MELKKNELLSIPIINSCEGIVLFIVPDIGQISIDIYYTLFLKMDIEQISNIAMC